MNEQALSDSAERCDVSWEFFKLHAKRTRVRHWGMLKPATEVVHWAARPGSESLDLGRSDDACLECADLKNFADAMPVYSRYDYGMNQLSAQVPAQNRMLRLREALEASWDEQTAYEAVKVFDNPALGQCYPTSRVVQHFYPSTEIIKGKVWTGKSEKIHFWNGLLVGDQWYHIDLSWQQFPLGSVVRDFSVLDRRDLNDSEATLHRCALLLKRVEGWLRDRP